MLIFSSTAVYVRGVAQNLPAENRSNGAAAAMRRCIVAKNVRRRHGERTGKSSLICSCSSGASVCMVCFSLVANMLLLQGVYVAAVIMKQAADGCTKLQGTQQQSV